MKNRSHSQPWLVPSLASTLLFALFLSASPRARADMGIGDTFPSLAAAGIDTRNLPDLRGKVVLVDFWASWCAPCKASFPFYSKLGSAYASSGLVIVGVSVDQDPGAYQSFVRKMSPGFPVVLDASQNLVASVKVPTMPTCYLLDRKGRVRAIHPGFHGGETEQLLKSEITALLSETP